MSSVTDSGEDRAYGGLLAPLAFLSHRHAPLPPHSSRSSSRSWMRTTCVTSSGESASPSTGPTCTSCTTSMSPPRTTRTSPWSHSSPWTGRAPLQGLSPGHSEKGGVALGAEAIRTWYGSLASHPLSAQKAKGSCLLVTVAILRKERRETNRLDHSHRWEAVSLSTWIDPLSL